MIKKLSLLSCFVVSTSFSIAQEIDEKKDTIKQLKQQVLLHESAISVLKQFKISGYIQAQIQHGEKNATLRVGSANTNTQSNFNRFGIRRGRIKITYEKGIATGVFQLDITEKRIRLRDAYLAIKDPWVGSNVLKAGVFDRPFGYEVMYSSSRRESPERATVITTLFPDEKDMGVVLTLQAPKTSPWNVLKLDAGMLAGNTINADLDNRKDFIGHLSFNKELKQRITIGGGVSYYWGGVYQGSSTVYSMRGSSFVSSKDTANFGAFAKREYFGIDAQLATTTSMGLSSLYGEYILGTQPGDKNNTVSPNYATLPTSPTYIRSFNGYYITYVQDLGKIPLSLILKYDYYDPNTKVSKNQIGLNGSGSADIAYTTLGSGLMWRINNSLRLTAYYDHVSNETSSHLTGYSNDLSDNVFTLRLQYKY